MVSPIPAPPPSCATSGPGHFTFLKLFLRVCTRVCVVF